MSPPLHDHAGLDPADRATLSSVVGGFTALSQVLEWGRTSTPPLAVDDIVTMDEYTHDVLVKVPGGHYLAFDTT